MAKGSTMSRFMGRATRTVIPNSWQHSIDWRKQIKLNGKEIEKQVKKKERTVGKKLTFEKTEDVLIQNLKTRKWDTKSTIMEVRVSDDGTVFNYDVMKGDLLTTRHLSLIHI